MSEEFISIGEVAKRSGIAASALRYYEEKGLIEHTARQGQTRLYPPSITERLALITLGQHAGFSLNEIAEVLTSDGYELDREQLSNKAEEIDRQIQRLSLMRDGLLHAANCNAPTHSECPKFQRILRFTQQQKVKETETQSEK
ncbi:helix-turn-helix domain-containing protein [uncultured Pseudoteredinibacter sp.]|uniref:helix-turn-helix domain-containing protein n=1 Tax=uncultured Pseudoteredinibacter sp. TaxID=1641701 RepID=UPI00341531B2